MVEEVKKLERESRIAKAGAAAEILLDLRNQADHGRRMIESYAHDLECDYLTEDEKTKSARKLLERQEKVELLDQICDYIVGLKL